MSFMGRDEGGAKTGSGQASQGQEVRHGALQDGRGWPTAPRPPASGMAVAACQAFDRPVCFQSTAQPRPLTPPAPSDLRPSSPPPLQAIDRRERLRRLALETIDLSKDPYFMRNHLGQYECRLCLTLHTNEGNYLAHTQGKRHQQNLAKRAAREAAEAPVQPAPMRRAAVKKTVKIGRPGYRVTKQYDPEIGARCMLFQVSRPQRMACWSASSGWLADLASCTAVSIGIEKVSAHRPPRPPSPQIEYPEIEEGSKPRHRFMSAYEQRKEAWDKNYQYLLFAAEPYEVVAFKIPNLEVDKAQAERLFSHWDPDGKVYSFQVPFKPAGAAQALPPPPPMMMGGGGMMPPPPPPMMMGGGGLPPPPRM